MLLPTPSSFPFHVLSLLSVCFHEVGVRGKKGGRCIYYNSVNVSGGAKEKEDFLCEFYNECMNFPHFLENCFRLSELALVRLDSSSVTNYI